MDHRRYGGLPNQPEAALCQILQEAQHRWLRPTEVCEILRNYRKFKLTPDPPHKPQSGSLFLFDRKALRYFRKDGHNWRKKKDGKTVREAHERLKAGSVEVLHCYYAHGEENENFQRRSYWMLDTNEHIVLVHYREVKEGSRSGLRSPNSYSVDGNASFANSGGVAGSSPQTSPLVSPRSSSPNTSADWNGGPTYSPEGEELESSDDTDQSRVREVDTSASNATTRGAGVAVPNAGGLPSSMPYSASNQNGASYGEKGLPFLYENTNGSAAAAYPSVLGAVGAQSLPVKMENGAVTPPGGFDLLEYCEVLKSWGSKETSGITNMMLPIGTDQYREKAVTTNNSSTWLKDSSEMAMNDGMGAIQAALGNRFPAAETSWRPNPQGYLDTMPNPVNKYHSLAADGLDSLQVANKQNSNATPWRAVLAQLADNGPGQGDILDGFGNDLLNDVQRAQHSYPQSYQDTEQPYISESNSGRFDMSGADNKDASLTHSYSNVFRDFQADFPTQQDEHDAFRKFESFGRWMGTDIGGDGMLLLPPDSNYCWASALAEEVPGMTQQMHLDIAAIPSLPHENCFSITDFSPNCAVSTIDTKVLVSGKFGDKIKDPSEIKWSCMFGDVEVPAELLQPGVLRCNAPAHLPGKVPFCVTRSDKIACSEIKEFEYHAECKSSSAETFAAPSSKRDMLFQIRLARMLSNVSGPTSQTLLADKLNRGVPCELSSLGLFDEWEEMEDQLTESGCLGTSLKEQFVQKLLKEKLQFWLVHKILEAGRGAAIWDDNGLGVLHMGAALGYTWIIAPTLAAGVNINFRDSRGWTALHWAAHCGRETMVVALMASGAAPGAKTDPTNVFPLGQTPADLASAERHKGIAGYLAESSLTSHLSTLTLKSKQSPGTADAVESLSERTIVQPIEGGSQEQLSLQDSLQAVRNATQAAARIQSEFRVESFRKKQESYQLEEDEYGISNEEAQYIVAAQKQNRGGLFYEDDELSHVAAIRIQQKYRGWKGRRNFLLFRQHVVKIQAHFRGHQVRKQYKKIIWSVSIVEKAILRWRRKGRGLRGFESAALAANAQGGSDGDEDFLKIGRKQIEAGLEKALARVQSMVRSPEAREQYRRLVEGYQKTKVHLEGNAYDTSFITEDKEQFFSEDFAMSTYH